ECEQEGPAHRVLRLGTGYKAPTMPRRMSPRSPPRARGGRTPNLLSEDPPLSRRVNDRAGGVRPHPPWRDGAPSGQSGAAGLRSSGVGVSGWGSGRIATTSPIAKATKCSESSTSSPRPLTNHARTPAQTQPITIAALARLSLRARHATAAIAPSQAAEMAETPSSGVE